MAHPQQRFFMIRMFCFMIRMFCFMISWKKHPAAKAQNASRQRRRQEIIGSKHFTKEIQRGMTATGEHSDYWRWAQLSGGMFCFMISWKNIPPPKAVINVDSWESSETDISGPRQGQNRLIQWFHGLRDHVLFHDSNVFPWQMFFMISWKPFICNNAMQHPSDSWSLGIQ